jgi:hypothetical protein
MSSPEDLPMQKVPEEDVAMLLNELKKRVMVVGTDGLQHLIDRGVVAPAAAEGCCAPSGGTCCPNRHIVLE